MCHYRTQREREAKRERKKYRGRSTYVCRSMIACADESTWMRCMCIHNRMYVRAYLTKHIVVRGDICRSRHTIKARFIKGRMRETEGEREREREREREKERQQGKKKKRSREPESFSAEALRNIAFAVVC